MEGEHDIARRTVLVSAGVGIGAGLVSGLAPAQAEGAAAGEAEIWSSDYWANKGGVKLNLWRKRVGAPKPSEKPLPILFLVHGSSNSTRSSYDLSVPGKGEYSLMNVMAREGYDVWTMDHDGYGHSGSSGNNSDIASGVEDLKAAMPVITKETGLQKMHMYGTSSGGIRAAAFAQAQPRTSTDLSCRPSPTRATARPKSRGGGRASTNIAPTRAGSAMRAMIRSIFTRDGHPGAVDPAVPEAIIAAEMKFGDTIPTGTYLDMAANLPIVDPKKVLSPVLMLRGIWDGNSTDADLLEFYTQLPNGDRQFVILPETAHSPGYGKNRHLLYYAIKNFLAAPAPIAAS